MTPVGDRPGAAKTRRYTSPRPGSGVNPGPFSASAYTRGLRRARGGERQRGGKGGAGLVGIRVLRQRPNMPPFWQKLDPASVTGSGLAGEIPDQSRLNLWLLVLEAKKIPHRLVLPERRFTPGRSRSQALPGTAVYVPPLHARAAMSEILAVEAERSVAPRMAPARENVLGVLVFFTLLALWHAYRWEWFVPADFGIRSLLPAEPSAWAAAFGLDVYRFRVLHEFWRSITALTLHADDAHLFSNAAFGIFLFSSLCRRVGLGMGLLLGLMGGILGNAANGLYRPPGALSIGFSTAVFASIGALCAVTCADVVRYGMAAEPGRGSVSFFQAAGPYVRPALAPLAAGLALLAILGGGWEAKTDYAAHVWGFVGGLACALAGLPLLYRLDSLPRRAYSAVQTALFALTVALPLLAWSYSLYCR